MLNKYNFKSIIPLWVIGIFYILPILITNNLYYDDIGRSIYGYFSWGIDGRPLADLFFSIINLGSPATDIAPYPQIVSILMMTTLCYFMHKALNPDRKLGWLLFTPIFLSPFFIQNLAFRFDSLTMTLSIAIAALPLFFMKKGNLKLLTVSAFSVFASLSLYQASLSVFAAVICLYVLFSIKDSVSPYVLLREIVIAMLGMMIGYLGYSNLIIPVFVTSEYANSYNQIISSASELKINIDITINILHSFFTGWMAKIFIIIFSLSFFGLIAVLVKILRTKKPIAQRITSAILFIISLVVILVCIPGPSIALKSMPVGPRVFIGFGFAISASLVLISFITDKSKLNAIYGALIVISFSYMATFTNAMKSQDRMTDRIIYGVTNDIIKIGYNNVKTITIDSKPLYTPIADKSIQKFPLMGQMIPSYFDGNLAWGVVRMIEIYSGKDQPTQVTQNELISKICEMNLITDAGLYKTYYLDGNLVVSFSFRKC